MTPQGHRRMQDELRQLLRVQPEGGGNRKFGQRIVNGVGLTERTTVVSFSMAYRSFRGGSGRLDTRLDTPPSINRRHPDSCLVSESESEWLYSIVDTLCKGQANLLMRSCTEAM